VKEVLQDPIDVLVLDENLAPLSGTEVAEMAASAGAGVSVVLLRRGGPGPAEAWPVLDPIDPAFDAPLSGLLEGTAHPAGKDHPAAS
jgi:hypothetical protein